MALNSEQVRNARTIISVGRELGASSRDILIALMTAMQESTLRNLSWGDRDSVGLFQQRAPWGSFSQRTDPRESARMFFQGGHGGQRGLFDFSNRNQMSLTQAAQAVQVSAFPDAYAKHEDVGRSLLSQYGKGVPPPKGGDGDQAEPGTLGEVPGIDFDPVPIIGGDVAEQDFLAPQLGELTAPGLDTLSAPALDEIQNPALGVAEFGQPVVDDTGLLEDMLIDLDMGGTTETSTTGGAQPSQGVSGGSAPKGWAAGVINMARKFLGTQYVWGGNRPGGFDCSGLIQYLFAQQGRDLPRISADQARSGPRISLDDLKPGDLVAWDNSSRNNGADHIALYIGGGRIIEAPRPGSVVQISNIYDRGRAWGVRM